VPELDAEELMRELNAVRRTVRRRLRATLDRPPLTPSQVEVIRVVEDEPGTGVAAAARSLHLADNTVSGVVNQLAGAGLLRRETDPEDRRVARLYLTDATTRLLRQWRSARTDLVQEGLARLAAGDRAAIGAALPALHRLAALLSTVEAGSGPGGGSGRVGPGGGSGRVGPGGGKENR
jgi:DNA-binding MarR family transcriptional regulator